MKMAYMQRLFLSRRFNVKQIYFSCACRSETIHADVMASSAVKSPNFNLCISSTVQKIHQPIKQFCTLRQQHIAENNNNDGLVKVPFKNLSEIDLTNSDLINTFRSLFQVYKNTKNKSSVSFQNELMQFVHLDQFKNYCNALEQKLPLLTAQELKLLLNLEGFHVPATSVLMQKIYHLVIEKINEYSPVDIIMIYYLISSGSHKDNSKSRVLQLICKEYFRSKLYKDLCGCKDYNGIAYFTKFDKVPIYVRRKLMSVLGRKFNLIHNELNLSSLCRMFAAFRDESLHSYFNPVMLDVLKSRITEKPTFLQTRNILIGFKHLLLKDVNYDENFFNALAENSIEKIQAIKAIANLCNLFFELEHLHMPLIRYFESRFLDPNFITTSQKLGLDIAKILSNSYYHPFGYKGDDLNHVDCIKKLESINFQMLNISEFVEWCLCLTILGSQRKMDYINQLFTCLAESYDNGTNVKLGPTTLEGIIILHAFSREYFPVDFYQLPETFLKKCHNCLKTESIKTLHDMARNFFCKNSWVLEYCTTSLQHFIDFAVLTGESDVDLIAENKMSIDTLKIENIKKSPSSKLILYHMYRGMYPCQFRNSSVLPGKIQLILQSYEKFNCSVVFLHEKHMRRLNPNQQYLYLAEKIKENQ